MRKVNAQIFTMAAMLFLFIAGRLVAQDHVVPIDSLHWNLKHAVVGEVEGKACIGGTILLKKTLAVNFLASYNMYVSGARSYPGILFRKQTDLEFERIYFRPHLPSFFQNVVQHVSTFNGMDSWQLYTGAGHTASLAIPLRKWFRVRLEVRERTASLYIDDNPVPVLVVEDVLHGDSPGAIELDGGGEGAAWFSDFTLKQVDTELVSDAPPKPVKPGMVEKWELSQPFKLTDFELEKYPISQVKGPIAWKKVKCRDDGILDVSRHSVFKGKTANVIFARTSITAGSDQSKLYAFGYSDVVAVFLNGTLVFMGNSSYTSRDPHFQGVVGLNDYLNLPLKKGENELMIALAETFGGWGFIFQDAKAEIQDQRLTKQWEIASGLRFPESVVYDGYRDCLYVSNFYNDGAEFISKVTPDGTVIKMDWVTGVAQPAGMVLSNNKLYVACRFAVVEIDPDKGMITNRFKLNGAAMPNGITADASGNLFVTDTRRNCIYTIANGIVEEWLCSDELGRPNGILFFNGKILVGGSGDGRLKEIDMATKAIRTLVTLEPGSEIDGIRPDGKGGIFFSDYKGRLYHLGDEEKPELLLDARVPQQFCASFEYVPGKGLLIIPSLFDNKLVTYKYNP